MRSMLTFARSPRNSLHGLTAGLVALAALLAEPALAADVPPPGKDLLRYDPITDTLVSVAESEARVGCVYSHYSERLHRRVWAIRQADGGFSNAFGETTTQSGWALEVRASREEYEAKLEEVDRQLLQRVGMGGVVYFALRKDGRWILDRNSTHPTVYDAETKFRWEWSGDGYARVSSAPFAYRWDVVDGRFIPIPESPAITADCFFCAPPPQRSPACGCRCDR